MTNFERRTEMRPSITYPRGMPLDEHPYQTRSGRLVPGYQASLEEFSRLQAISDAIHIPEEGRLPVDLDIIVPTPRQLARIAINVMSGCWELPVYDDPKPRARYGTLTVPSLQSTKSLAHRTMFMVLYGQDAIPESMVLDHLCEHKPCCYPRHLEPITMAENTRRGRQQFSTDQITLFDKVF